MAFTPRWDPGMEAEGPVRMTWRVEARTPVAARRSSP